MSRSPFLRVFLAFLTAALLAVPDLLSPQQAGWADVGELPEPGGLVTPGDKTDEIRMKSESVLFSVRPNDGTFPGGGACYAHVTADFVMQNLTARAVTMTLFFPLHSTSDVADFQLYEPLGGTPSRNIKVRVGGHETAFAYQLLDVSEDLPTTDGQQISAVFGATFSASAEWTARPCGSRSPRVPGRRSATRLLWQRS